MIFDEVVNLRTQYKTLETAKDNAMNRLPAEPCTLVDQYLIGKERPSKEQVVTNRHTRYSTPAIVAESESEIVSCNCKGKCATRACNCKKVDVDCGSTCGCSEVKCKNRQ